MDEDPFRWALRHVVVWVTKMDDFTVQFDAARYEEIKKFAPRLHPAQAQVAC